MKNMKKVLAFVIAMIMVLGMTVTAFASGNTEPTGGEGGQTQTTLEKTIKVNGLAAGDTVKYVQVIKWDAATGSWAKAPGFENLDDVVFNEIVGSAQVAGKITDASATAVAALATSMTDGGSVTGTSWEKGNLDPGLYMVQAVPTTADVIYNPVFVAIQANGTGSEVTLPLNYSDNGTAKKSDVTVDKKAKSRETGADWSDATTEDVGDIIDFKVETTVPAYLESYTNPVFTVHDELSDGLTFAVKEGEGDAALTDITVKVGTTALTLGTDYTITQKTAKEWTIDFSKAYLQGRTAATVVTIEYQAKITDYAKNVNPETNTVSIEYSRNPSDADDHGTKEDKTKHYTFDIDAGLQGDSEYTTSEIIKVAVDANGQPILEEKEYSNEEKHHPLAGAKFKLYKDQQCTQAYTNSTITEDTEFETDDMGRMEIKGLDEGVYYLKESSPAPGYTLITEPVKFEITAQYKTVPATETCNSYQELDYYEVKVNGTTTSHYTIDKGTVTKTSTGSAGDVGTEIVNKQGHSLPSTGGIGTTLFYIIGSILVIGAGIILVVRRRMSLQ